MVESLLYKSDPVYGSSEPRFEVLYPTNHLQQKKIFVRLDILNKCHNSRFLMLLYKLVSDRGLNKHEAGTSSQAKTNADSKKSPIIPLDNTGREHKSRKNIEKTVTFLSAFYSSHFFSSTRVRLNLAFSFIFSKGHWRILFPIWLKIL